MSTTTDVFFLSHALVDAEADARPIWATLWGVPGQDHRWGDLSPAGCEARHAALAGFQARADALPEPSSRDEALATAVLHDYLRLQREAREDEVRDLNILASTPQLMTMALDSMDTASPAGREAAHERLATVGDALTGFQQTLARGFALGRPVAARQVRGVVAQAAAHAGPDSTLRALGDAIGASSTGAAAAEAFASFGAWLEREALPQATPVDAVGVERYGRAARQFLGADLDLRETYAWGWSRVHAILAEMRQDAAGFGATVPEALAALRDDPGQLGDPALLSADPEAFIATMRERQARALAAVEGEFDIPEALRTLTVQRAPPGNAPGAWYVPPSEDLSRAGAVWYGLPTEDPVPLFDQVSTAYHEGFPGHHLQCGLQVAMADRLSRLHRVAYGYSGFAEGWALYAEQRMDELGQYEHPAYRLGMWSNQMARACRVVVDIGLHTGAELGLQIPDDAPIAAGEPWSFEVAVRLMTELGGLTEARSRSEVTRYLGWPGQAISYSVGQRAMLDLRDRWVAAKGSDLRPFHARVLATGNVALDQLERWVIEPSPAGWE